MDQLRSVLVQTRWIDACKTSYYEANVTIGDRLKGGAEPLEGYKVIRKNTNEIYGKTIKLSPQLHTKNSE